MSSWPIYNKGEWDAICDACGQKFKSSELRKRWDGLMVCHKDYEVRQPQDFVRAKVDIQAVPWTRPEPSDGFVCTPCSSSAWPGIALPGCALPNNIRVDPSFCV